MADNTNELHQLLWLRLKHRAEVINFTCWRCDKVYQDEETIVHGLIIFSPDEVEREEFEGSEHRIQLCTTCAAELGIVEGFRVNTSYEPLE